MIRQMIEELEKQTLSERAAPAGESRGRLRPEPGCQVRTVFQQDRDRILHSKAFRRLKGKTQVFIAPEGDHYRTRITHTLEVAQISRTVARALRLNEDLTEAIALGHDLGHTPFGHAGESALDSIYKPGFSHRVQSLRVVDVLERRKDDQKRGLNLTWEVRDGILCHSGPQLPSTLEGQIVRICDRVAYVNHDIDDAIRAGMITEADLPKAPRKALGESRSERIDTMVKAMIEASEDSEEIRMTEEIWQAMMELRSWLFDNIYIGSAAKKEEGKVGLMLGNLYDFYLNHPECLPAEWTAELSDDLERCIVDYIAGMTDHYAMREYAARFLPRAWSVY